MDPHAPRAVLLVSACLLGRPVRYDGRDKYTPLLLQRLAPWCRFTALCPEVGAGLGTPRPPIALYETNAGVRLQECDDRQRDVTVAVRDQVQQVTNVHGALLKARSPSCGLGTAVLHQSDGSHSLTDGAFSSALRAQNPLLPIADEVSLQQPARLQNFVLAVWRYRQGMD